MVRKRSSYSPEEKAKIAQMGLANRGRKHTKEELQKMRLAHLGKKHTDEEIEKIRLSKLGAKNPNYQKHPSPETRGRLSASKTGAGNHQWRKSVPQERRERISASLTGANHPNYGKPRDDDIVRKIMKSNKAKPNKAERKLEDILNHHFPNAWKFVGDGQYIIGGLCPDFLNVNGKQIIELFGDYWHSAKQVQRANQTEEGRVKHYREYFLDCLVLWERELKDETQLVVKIQRWIKAD